ncbi:MDR/zinc-dependent alcohol dehydrogenase-like family protein [Sphingobium amiense]|nr:zinc-binding dehydrogenase [Sphingobium amiense]
MSNTGRELRSRIDADGAMTLSLEQVAIAEPGDDELVVRVEAAPINPTDLGLLTGPADLTTMEVLQGERTGIAFTVPQERLPAFRGRLGQSLRVGSEGAGTVVRAGRNLAGLEGRRVGMIGDGMYADYRLIGGRNFMLLPDGANASDGASMFINPLTALGLMETAGREGHKAIVHTAAASNVGQMLQKICLADGMPLINIVRSQEQVDILRGLGAVHVLNSKNEAFSTQLAEVIAQTGATIAFDPIGGGKLGGKILQAMERAAVAKMPSYDRYGSSVFKQLYIYGALDLSPTILNRAALGFRWSVSGWLLWPFLHSVGPEVEDRLRQRVIEELTTTFATHYTRTISLAEALEPEVLLAYKRLATGEKYLIDPTRG